MATENPQTNHRSKALEWEKEIPADKRGEGPYMVCMYKENPKNQMTPAEIMKSKATLADALVIALQESGKDLPFLRILDCHRKLVVG